MTEHKMTDEMRKILTEFLGERWHVPYRFWDYGCGMMREAKNRTFTNDADMLAVFRAIRDKGKWSEFYRFTGKHWLKDDDAWEREEPLEVWLFMGSYERACCLAADFLEEQG